MNSIYEIRILVVDDNTDLLRLLQEQLTDAGYRHIQTVPKLRGSRKGHLPQTSPS